MRYFTKFPTQFTVSNLNEADQLEVIIKWRDDGDIFATSVPTPQGRRIRIYSRDGNHLSLGGLFSL